MEALFHLLEEKRGISYWYKMFAPRSPIIFRFQCWLVPINRPPFNPPNP